MDESHSAGYHKTVKRNIKALSKSPCLTAPLERTEKLRSLPFPKESQKSRIHLRLAGPSSHQSKRDTENERIDSPYREEQQHAKPEEEEVEEEGQRNGVSLAQRERGIRVMY